MDNLAGLVVLLVYLECRDDAPTPSYGFKVHAIVFCSDDIPTYNWSSKVACNMWQLQIIV